MAKAARHLSTSQPVLSKTIAELEHALGVRLLDRGPQGVAPTIYGQALINRGRAIFDELREGIKEIEFLADPTVGQITVGGNEATSAALLPAVFGRLRRRHPGLSMHVVPILSVAQQYQELHERRADLIAGRLPSSIDKDIDAEILFHDRLFVVAGPKNKWVRKRKIAFSELANEPWVLPPLGTVAGSLVADVFRSHGMEFPPKGAAMGAIHLFFALLASGPFLLPIPGSLLRLGTHLPPLKVFMSRMLNRPDFNVAIVMLGDFARSLPGSDHASALSATVIGKYVKQGTTGKMASNVTLPAGCPAVLGFWSYLSAVTKTAGQPLGPNLHPTLV